MTRLVAGLLAFALAAVAAAAAVPARWFVAQDPTLASRLAAMHVPAADGALGRNRQAYFHARFQMGVHRLATAAVLHRDPRRAEAALRAIEYAFERQATDGGFAFALPADLRDAGAPSRADLASGSAFFLASAGPALHLLGDPAAADWLPAPLRQRVAALRPRLARALEHMASNQALLRQADARAPNRLLFDALSLHSLGRVLDDPAALQAARGFTQAALDLQHPEGYFLEGGGPDTSYNGVAIAAGYRLLALDPEDEALAQALARASDWQHERIGGDGRISVAGNTRVYPGGEHFLGKPKSVDAAHTVEALMLAAAARGDPRLLESARRVAAFYGGE